MHTKFLEYLVDPFTRQRLRFEGEIPANGMLQNGFLVSDSNRYPIVRGVPRFVPKANYAESFGWQWNHWSRVQFDSSNQGKPMEGYTGRMWHTIAALGPSTRLDGKIILDIGCGPGRFLETTRTLGAAVIGVDYSDAVDAAAKNFAEDPDVCILQADALKLPIASDTLDGAFSIGVLHHTPNPAGGVDEAFRVLRQNGWFAVSVYGKGGYYNYPNVQAWRWLLKRLWPVLGEKPALAYTYFTVHVFGPIAKLSRTAGRVLKVPFPFISLPDKDWSMLDTFDSVTPSYQSGHESYEVFSWLRNSGFERVEPSDWGYTTFRGVKPKR
jgi:SAM-dependent methyltransferase